MLITMLMFFTGEVTSQTPSYEGKNIDEIQARATAESIARITKEEIQRLQRTGELDAEHIAALCKTIQMPQSTTRLRLKWGNNEYCKIEKSPPATAGNATPEITINARTEINAVRSEIELKISPITPQ